MRHMRSAAAVLVAAVAGFVPVAAAGGDAVVLRCGAVLDVEAKRLRGASDIRVIGKHIDAVVTAADGATEEGQSIDLRHATCLPGLMDMHVHLMLSTDRPPAALYYTRSSAAKALMAMRNAQTLLHHGFTTIRIVGDLDYHFAPIDLRDAIDAGEIQGPRMLVAPHILGIVGGHSDLNDAAPDLPYAMRGTPVASGVDAVRDAVRREIKYGADWIKITASGGAMSMRDDPRVQQFTDDEIRAVVDEAHRHGKRVAAHVHGSRAGLVAALAGVDSIEHGTMLEADAIRAMARQGTFLVPTVHVVDWVVERGRAAGIPEENLAKVALVRKTRDEAFVRAYKAGVRFAFGSDPLFPYEDTAREFAAMVGLGMSPMDALLAATANAAALLGLEDRIGSLRAGMLADIVAVPGNPLDDIRVMERVEFVMKEGAIIRHGAAGR